MMPQPPPPTSVVTSTTNEVNLLHRGPCTPPAEKGQEEPETLEFSRGPQTPSISGDDDEADVGRVDDGGDAVDDVEGGEKEVKNDGNDKSDDVSNNNNLNDNDHDEDDDDDYDPCNPTEESPVAADADKEEPAKMTSTSNRPNGLINLVNGDSLLMKKTAAAADEIPFLADNDPVDMDMDEDSPCSPLGSDLSDLFEPPEAPSSASVSVSAFDRLSGGSSSAPAANHRRPGASSSSLSSKRSKKHQQHYSKAKAKKSVQMRMEDKLKIIDDVPTSAVEMAVKEKVQ